ncbi:hypothetical protein [Caballeronia sp. AZ7_KS35]|uniref:hypothetical protein n=1 Tax=Caballeronia sp. AZ7_KS35 TaxID=2921762 RepID=UPI002027AB35|nr:hypothetical protein [Caballeronia sp. AZ7_KS35]
MTDAPFNNCQFRECDLPGQCRSEGKCHHPRAAGASEGQAEPIYQTCFIQGQWRDVDRFEYDRAKSLRDDLARIVYPASSGQASPAASSDARDAARYRELRHNGFDNCDNEKPYIAVHKQDDWGNWHDTPIVDDDADDAIDAAIAAQRCADGKEKQGC